MIRDFIKWVMPGVATVLGGTTLCVAMTSGDISRDLDQSSQAAMAAGDYDWAELSLDMRDLTLTGTTTDTANLQAAIARLESLPGVRSVGADVTLAPMAQPYLLTAAISAKGSTLSGGVPDETARRNLLARAGLDEASLQLRSGMPDRQAWTAGAQFAIDNLKYLDQGEISISDLTVNLSGRAKSERDYRDLLIVMRAGPPAGVSLGEVSIAPALVEPYQWSASFDGERIDVTGFVPDDDMAERLRTADVGGVPVATGLALGSGEPQGFADLSETLLVQLAKLEFGSATINGTQSTLTGAPASIEIAQAVVDTLQPSGSIVTLEPPRIADYWMSATRQPGGLTIFDGYAPDEATRAAIGQRAGADVTWLKLGRGAPERYQSGVDFGLSALDLLSEGRFALRDNVMTLSGIARSTEDYEALRATLAQGAPQGLVLAMSEVQPPNTGPFSWAVTKDSDGAIALSGLVPSPEVETTLLAAAGEGASESMTYASGAPNTFVASAETAIDLLSLLADGRIAYDGSGWIITGTAKSAADRAALETSFSDQKLASAGWSMAVADPMPAVSEPAIAPVAVAEAPVEPAPAAEPSPAVTPEPVAAAEPAVVPEPVVAPEVVAEAAPAAEAVIEATPEVVPEVVPVDPDYAFSARRAADGSVVLSGQVPDNAALNELGAIASGDIAAVSISDGAPQDFVTSAEAGLRALMQLSEGDLSLEQGQWSLTGIAADETIQSAVLATVSGDWTTSVDLIAAPAVAGAEPGPAPEPEPAITPAAAADLAACAAPVAQFSAGNAIFFQSGAAAIAAQSNAALDELAVDLAACPRATVHVEGHTDSDGDEALNLALSVARAEAVVQALVERGVAADRLYAVGYGESAPIADNATSEGKRINRRIVVTVKAGD